MHCASIIKEWVAYKFKNTLNYLLFNELFISVCSGISGKSQINFGKLKLCFDEQHALATGVYFYTE